MASRAATPEPDGSGAQHDAAAGAPPGERTIPLATYRYVRVGLVAVVAGLFASVLMTALAERPPCWQTSVSAFYFTTTHAVFVGALCAAGICLIAYKGTTAAEDILLNVSGLLAVVVALVPTVGPADSANVAQPVCGLWLPTQHDTATAIPNNVVALLTAAGSAVLVLLIVRRRALRAPAEELAEPSPPSAPPAPTGGVATAARLTLMAAQLFAPALAAGLATAAVIWFVVDRSSFIADAHNYAAVAMFVAIIAVVVLYACYATVHRCRCGADRRGAARRYGVIAAVMVATLLAIAVLHWSLPTWNHWVLGAESLLIGEFAWFWVVQTRDLWFGPYCVEVPGARRVVGELATRRPRAWAG